MVLSDYCNPCERKSIESKSVGWCCECEEGLCDKCLQDHKAIKMTQYHHVVKITSQDIVDNYHLLSIPNCEQHPELKEDLLCRDHDVLCCNGCLVTEHKTCKNVVPLDVAAKGVKSSELFQAIKRSLATNKKVSNEVMAERQASEEELKRQEQRVRKEIANIKSRFMEHINNLEKSLLSELAEIPKENTAASEKEKQEIGTIEREIEADENAVTFVAEHGSESQIFSFLLKLKKKQIEIKEKFEKIPPTSRVTITLEEACHKIEAVDSLGFLSVRYDSVIKSEEKIDQSGMLNRQVGICPQLKVENEIEIDPKHFLMEEQTLLITDFVVTEENQLLVIGNLTLKGEITSNFHLIKYDEGMKFVKSFNIASVKAFNSRFLNSLTCVPKSQRVVLSDAVILHFVNSKTMTKMWPSVHLKGSYIKDVTANTIHIFVLQTSSLGFGGADYIIVCDLIGCELETINLGRHYTSLIWQPNNNFLFTSPELDLTSVKPDGSHFFQYHQNGINVTAVDSNGSIYMAVEDGIAVMHLREQQVQKVFSCSPDAAKQIIGLEIYKDNSSCVVLYRKQQDSNVSYCLQVLRALK